MFSLSNGVKATKEMQHFSITFNYNVFKNHFLTVSLYYDVFSLYFHVLYNLYYSVFLN